MTELYRLRKSEGYEVCADDAVRVERRRQAPAR